MHIFARFTKGAEDIPPLPVANMDASVARIVEMGFSSRAARDALNDANGDEAAAVAALVGGAGRDNATARPTFAVDLTPPTVNTDHAPGPDTTRRLSELRLGELDDIVGRSNALGSLLRKPTASNADASYAAVDRGEASTVDSIHSGDADGFGGENEASLENALVALPPDVLRHAATLLQTDPAAAVAFLGEHDPSVPPLVHSDEAGFLGFMAQAAPM